MGRRAQSKRMRRSNPGESRNHSFARQVSYQAAPIGVVHLFAGAALPDGYLWCRGGSFSATDYPKLAALLGGTTLPDLRSRVPVGAGGAGPGLTSRANGGTGGAEEVTLVLSDIPSHNHNGANSGGSHDHGGNTNSTGAHDHVMRGNQLTNTTATASANRITSLADHPGGDQGGTTSSAGNHSHTITNHGGHTHTIDSQGGGGSHNNMQPWYGINYIIRAA